MPKITEKKSIKKSVKKSVKKPTKKKVVATKKNSSPKTNLSRSEQNPIISPRPENNWEAWQTFNPGVILLDNRVHFVYRAIGEDGISRLGYAVSNDGLTIEERLNEPIYEHRPGQARTFNIYSFHSGGSWGGAEDPRLVQVEGEDKIYMTYTACDGGLRIGLNSIKIKDFLAKKRKWKIPVLISPPGEVHKNWLIFPEKINGRYAVLHSIKPNVQIEYLDNLEFTDGRWIESSHNGGPQKNCWDKWLRGAGAPPLKTKDGWLLFYHAMDNDWGKYKVGAMLLDLNDPSRIICRASHPILEPKEDYENNGYKKGVVYVSGAIIKDGNLLVYYGCSDSYIGVAYAKLDVFLEALKKQVSLKLKRKTLRKK